MVESTHPSDRVVSPLVSIAFTLSLFGSLVGLRAIVAPTSLWAWIALAGAALLLALAALRVATANRLGVYARAASPGAGRTASHLAVRLTRVDRSLFVLAGAFMAPLLIAIVSGTMRP